MEKLQAHINELQNLHTKLNMDLENYKKNNVELQKESEKMQGIINELRQEKESYQRTIVSPKVAGNLPDRVINTLKV